ncbi:MAG: nicotinamide-nucleotide amidohydrolase family protein [Gammaproteobacteria bacterium]|nr:MAG: nicotinamide-nucleotide amidohydrolase family protein [Gammaproteobacteria bacterium]
MDTSTRMLAQQLGELLLSKNATVTCAESCTGGGIASAITDIPGSSSWFRLGVVTYANITKQSMLNVSAATLAREGAVSEDVVIEMARGALVKADADISVAVSGIAGPDGGSEAKPVGTVWFCWARADGETSTACQHFEGDRQQVRLGAVKAALTGLIDLLKK